MPALKKTVWPPYYTDESGGVDVSLTTQKIGDILDFTSKQAIHIIDDIPFSEEGIQMFLCEIEWLFNEQKIQRAKDLYYVMKKWMIEGFISWKLWYDNWKDTQCKIEDCSKMLFDRLDSALDTFWVHFCVVKIFSLSSIEHNYPYLLQLPPQEFCEKIDRFFK